MRYGTPKWLLAFLEVCLLSGLPSVGQENQNGVPRNTGESQKRKHVAVKDDIQAIGTRKIRRQGD